MSDELKNAPASVWAIMAPAGYMARTTDDPENVRIWRKAGHEVIEYRRAPVDARPAASVSAPSGAVDSEASRALEWYAQQVLAWYAQQVSDCRKITLEGEAARQALDKDGGSLARAALTWQASQGAAVESAARLATGGDDKAMREAFEAEMVAAGYEKPEREHIENSQYLSQLDEDMYVGFRMALAARPATQASDARVRNLIPTKRNTPMYGDEPLDAVIFDRGWNACIDAIDAARQETDRGD